MDKLTSGELGRVHVLRLGGALRNVSRRSGYMMRIHNFHGDVLVNVEISHGTDSGRSRRGTIRDDGSSMSLQAPTGEGDGGR